MPYDRIFVPFLLRLSEDKSGVVKTVRSVNRFPVLLRNHLDIYDFSFRDRILIPGFLYCYEFRKVFFNQKMIPDISVDSLKEEVERFLLH